MRWPALALLLALPAVALAQPAEQSLAEMLAALKAAPNAEAASELEQRIAAAWLQPATPAVRLLLESGTAALHAHSPSEADADFVAATVLQPDLAEAWSNRALARFAMHDTAGAVEAAVRAVTLDPNHFTALRTLSFAAEAQGDSKGALAAWQKALALDPEMPGGTARLETLRRTVQGQSI